MPPMPSARRTATPRLDLDALDLPARVERAARRIRRYVRETPLEPAPALAGRSAVEVCLKLENLQHTGSFKARGAANKLASLSRRERARGVVAASSGNHAAAVARMSALLGCEATVFVPQSCAPAKVQNIRRLGARLEYHGTDVSDTEAFARARAGASGAALVAPYNDLEVVAGQGTVAREILAQGAAPDAVFVPIGGGGLASGIAGYLEAVCPATRVYGCQPRHSAVMARSVRAGRILDLESKPTLSDGTAGGIEPGAITFDICRACIDEFVLVNEREIAAAIRAILDLHHLVIEGAAAVAVAAFQKHRSTLAGQRVVIVISGGNLSTSTLQSLLLDR